MPLGRRLRKGWPNSTEKLFGNIHLTQTATEKLLPPLSQRVSGAEQGVISTSTPMEAGDSSPIPPHPATLTRPSRVLSAGSWASTLTQHQWGKEVKHKGQGSSTPLSPTHPLVSVSRKQSLQAHFGGKEVVQVEVMQDGAPLLPGRRQQGQGEAELLPHLFADR